LLAKTKSCRDFASGFHSNPGKWDWEDWVDGVAGKPGNLYAGAIN